MGFYSISLCFLKEFYSGVRLEAQEWKNDEWFFLLKIGGRMPKRVRESPVGSKKGG